MDSSIKKFDADFARFSSVSRCYHWVAVTISVCLPHILNGGIQTVEDLSGLIVHSTQYVSFMFMAFTIFVYAKIIPRILISVAIFLFNLLLEVTACWKLVDCWIDAAAETFVARGDESMEVCRRFSGPAGPDLTRLLCKGLAKLHIFTFKTLFCGSRALNGHVGFTLTGLPQQPVTESVVPQPYTAPPPPVTQLVEQELSLSGGKDEFPTSIPLFVREGGYDVGEEREENDGDLSEGDAGECAECDVPMDTLIETAAGMRVSMRSLSEIALDRILDERSRDEEAADLVEWGNSYGTASNRVDSADHEEDSSSDLVLEEDDEVEEYETGSGTSNQAEDEDGGAEYVNLADNKLEARTANTFQENPHRRAALLYPKGASTKMFETARMEKHSLPSLDGWLRRDSGGIKVPIARLSVDEHNISSTSQAGQPGNLSVGVGTEARLGREGMEQTEMAKGVSHFQREALVPKAHPSRLEEDADESCWVYEPLQRQ